MASPDWLGSLDTSDCVISSLCVHHLSGQEKQWLFAEIGKRISDRGAILLADIVKPQRSEAWVSFGEGWDRITQSLSVEKTGSTRLFEKFTQEKWNYFHTPDPYDKPSPLFDQLTWLKQAGFAVADYQHGAIRFNRLGLQRFDDRVVGVRWYLGGGHRFRGAAHAVDPGQLPGVGGRRVSVVDPDEPDGRAGRSERRCNSRSDDRFAVAGQR